MAPGGWGLGMSIPQGVAETGLGFRQRKGGSPGGQGRTTGSYQQPSQKSQLWASQNRKRIVKGRQSAQRKGKKRRYKKDKKWVRPLVPRQPRMFHYHRGHSLPSKMLGRRGDFCGTINIVYRLWFIFMTDPINNLLVSKRSKKLQELQPETSKPLKFLWKLYQPCKCTTRWAKFMALCPGPQKVKFSRKQNKQNTGAKRHRSRHNL